MAILSDAYNEEQIEDGTTRVVLRLKPSIAPMTAAILPLMRKDGQPEKAKEIYQDLAGQFSVYYDETGAIGKRYRRADEVGTPFAITVDYDTSKNDTVTVRHRDSMGQDRMPVQELREYIQKALYP